MLYADDQELLVNSEDSLQLHYTTLIILLKFMIWKYLMKKQKYLLLEGRVPSMICLYNKLLKTVNSFSYLRYFWSFTHDADTPNKITKFRKL